MTVAGLTSNQDGRFGLFTLASDGGDQVMRELTNVVLAKNHDGRMELVAMQTSETGYDPYNVLHRWQQTPDGDKILRP